MEDLNITIIVRAINWIIIFALAIVTKVWVYLNPPEPWSEEEEAEWEELLQKAKELDKIKVKREPGWNLVSGL